MTPESNINRRQFLATSTASAASAALATSNLAQAARTPKPLELGVDNFAVRAMKWKDKQLIDHAAKLGVDAVFITDFYAFPSLETGYLKKVRKYAAD